MLINNCSCLCLTVGAFFNMISKKYSLPALLVFVVTSLAGFGSVVNAKPRMDSAGLSGTIGINAGVNDSQDQFNIEGNEQIDSLSNSGEAATTVLLFPFFRLAYTTEDLQTQYFFGQSPQNILDSAIQYELGVTHKFTQHQSMTLAYIPHIPFLDETWSDPFLLNESRQKTDVDLNAVRVAYKFMPVQVEYAYATYEIEDEQSGSQNTACGGQACTAEQLALLDRNSDYQRLSLESSLPIWKGVFAKANVYYAIQDANGESQSFDEFHYSLSIMTKFADHFLSIQAAFSDREYATENPIFAQVHEEDAARYSIIYSYTAPFNIDNSNLNIIYQNKDIDANINFYDSSNQFVSVGMSYNF